jgi:hypothetical protein
LGNQRCTTVISSPPIGIPDPTWRHPVQNSHIYPICASMESIECTCGRPGKNDREDRDGAKLLGIKAVISTTLNPGLWSRAIFKFGKWTCIPLRSSLRWTPSYVSPPGLV